MIGYKLTNCNEFVRECNFQMPKTHRNGCRICVSTSSMKIWHFPNSMASMLYLEEVGWQENQPWDQSLSKVVKVPHILIIKWNRVTLESGIDVGQGITIGPGKIMKKNKRRALNKRRAWTKCANLCYKKPIKLENIHRPWEKFQNLINVGPLIRL